MRGTNTVGNRWSRKSAENRKRDASRESTRRAFRRRCTFGSSYKSFSSRKHSYDSCVSFGQFISRIYRCLCTKLSSLNRNDCISKEIHNSWTYVLPSVAYTSEISQITLTCIKNTVVSGSYHFRVLVREGKTRITLLVAA